MECPSVFHRKKRTFVLCSRERLSIHDTVSDLMAMGIDLLWGHILLTMIILYNSLYVSGFLSLSLFREWAHVLYSHASGIKVRVCFLHDGIYCSFFLHHSINRTFLSIFNNEKNNAKKKTFFAF